MAIRQIAVEPGKTCLRNQRELKVINNPVKFTDKFAFLRNGDVFKRHIRFESNFEKRKDEQSNESLP